MLFEGPKKDTICFFTWKNGVIILNCLPMTNTMKTNDGGCLLVQLEGAGGCYASDKYLWPNEVRQANWIVLEVIFVEVEDILNEAYWEYYYQWTFDHHL